MKTKFTALAIGALAVAVSLATAGDWPQFRGPERDGVSGEKGLLRSWPDSGLSVLWRVPLGEGFSGLSVVGERIYTMFSRDGGKDEFLVALNALTGEEVWRRAIGPRWVDRWGNGPRSTPTVEGERVYALGSSGNLAAVATESGAIVWEIDLREDYGAEPPRWGVATSPQVSGKLLLVNVGGKEGSSIVAFDKKTGKEVWRSQSDKAGYSAPLPISVGDRQQVLFLTATALVSLSPEDGSLLWREDWKTSYDVNASTPVFIAPDRVFVSTGYDVGGAMWRIGKDGTDVDELWRSREMKNKFSSSVHYQGYLYGFDEKTLKCLDPDTGETLWKKRDFGHGSLIAADGLLIVLGDAGQLALVEANHEVYKEKGGMEIFQGKSWTVPTLAEGHLYLRDEKEIVSLKVSD